MVPRAPLPSPLEGEGGEQSEPGEGISDYRESEGPSPRPLPYGYGGRAFDSGGLSEMRP